MRILTFTVLVALPCIASAAVFLGNPKVGIRVDRPAGDYVDGDVTLDDLVVHHCGGGSTTYAIDTTFDPVAGAQFAIAAGNHCGLTFHWGSDIVIDGPAYTVEHSASSTSVTIGTEIDPKLLSPCTVTSGSMSGGCPWLLVYVD